MKFMSIPGYSLALVLFVIGGRFATAQAPEAKPAAEAKKPENQPDEKVRKAVDRLVEQFRLHPAAPSDKAGQVALYLIDAQGGEATRIVSESEAWLVQSASPVWSHDGQKIVFDATPGTPDFRLTRLKQIRLTPGGHLSLTDLGPGNCPDFSPDDEQIMFLLNSDAMPGAAPGLWVMQADGSDRKRLENYGRPKWSPDNSRIMITSFGKPVSVTMIDVRPDGKSGNLQLPGYSFYSPPRWAGEETIVATIGEGVPETIALIDVSDPGQCALKKVLWKRNNGLDVVPMTANYSALTGRCVFVGRDGVKGLALYGFDTSKQDVPKRLETGDFDPLIQDPVFSPDGRYIVFSSNRPDRPKPGAPVAGRRPSVEAPVLTGITIDGDLKDWPPAMERHGIKNLHIFPPAMGRGGLENAFLTTSADLSASFSVGYDPAQQLIYLAVIVRDDKLIVGHTSSWDTDAVEVYVNGSNALDTFPWPQESDWFETLDASKLHTLQYLGLPSKEGPVFGIKKSAGEERSGKENPFLAFGDIKKTKTRMAFRREGDVTTYEWALQAFDRYPDRPTHLAPGMTIGFDIAIADRDVPAKSPLGRNDSEDDRPAWISWGPSIREGEFKHFNPPKLGEIILGRPPKP